MVVSLPQPIDFISCVGWQSHTAQITLCDVLRRIFDYNVCAGVSGIIEHVGQLSLVSVNLLLAEYLPKSCEHLIWIFSLERQVMDIGKVC